MVTAYSLGMAVAIMSAGTLGDIYGRKKLYLAGIALFTVSSVACGLAGSLDMLNAARAIQGIAAATVNVTSLALVSAAFPTHIDPATETAILAAVDRDFVEGIRISLACAALVIGLVLAAGFAWFPRGKGGIADATREAGALESEEAGRVASPEGAGLG